MIEKTVYFVRHGQSQDNAAPVFQSPDSALSELGRRQAGRVAERLCKLSFEALIASPFRRSSETAEIIAKVTGMEVEYSELFVERIKPTCINGKPYDDEAANAVWRKWDETLYTPGMRVSDGENFDDLVRRADGALTFLGNRAERSLVVVTHGYFLRTILARIVLGEMISGEIFRRFQHRASMENTGLTVVRHQGGFEEEPGWRVWVYNDHAHLG
jgi:broad specificity phosphatase PhoE